MNSTSWAWPNMFDVARNKINLLSDTASIVNRVKLLLLTEPTELFMVPNFGVGLRRFMFAYTNDNTIALIKDALVEQLRIWEPAVIPERTIVKRGLDYTGQPGMTSSPDQLNLTITLITRYLQTIEFGVTEKDINGLL